MTAVGVVPKTGASPLPDMVIACGLPDALSVIRMTAERLPAAVGLKVKLMIVDCPGLTVIGRLAEVKPKSCGFGPERLKLESTSALDPVLLTVTGSALLITPTG